MLKEDSVSEKTFDLFVNGVTRQLQDLKSDLKQDLSLFRLDLRESLAKHAEDVSNMKETYDDEIDDLKKTKWSLFGAIGVGMVLFEVAVRAFDYFLFKL